MTPALLAALVAAAVSVAAQPVVIRLLTRLDVIDIPNHRSSHDSHIPRGGAGIALGLVVGLAVFVLPNEPSPRGDGTTAVALGVAVALSLLFFVGLADDLLGLSALPRLVAQAIAGVALATSLGQSAWALVAVTLWVVALTNAANFMDGINGISGATAVLAGVFYAWTGSVEGDVLLTALGAVVAGAYAGFLPFNLPVARLFMGDSGSYLLGGALAVCSVLAWRAGAAVVVVVAPLLPYLTDTGITLARRALRRTHLLSAHREHTYQRLADVSGSHVVGATAIAGTTIVCVASTLLPTAAAWVTIVAVLACYLALPNVWPRLFSGSWQHPSSMSGGSR